MSIRNDALVVSVGLVLSVAVACGGDNPVAPTVNVPFSTTDLLVGSGATASAGQTLTVAYTGWLYEQGAADNKGTLFDQASSSSPFSFVLGVGQVIAGWDQGFAGMRVGGKRRLVIPPALAYGSQGAGGGLIPPNATLIFEVELLAVNEGGTGLVRTLIEKDVASRPVKRRIGSPVVAWFDFGRFRRFSADVS